MAKNRDFDFRWGIPVLDEIKKGSIFIYGFMLKNYAKLGITRDEMMCIIHLAAYHYDSENGQSSPSLSTIAKEMGYAHENSVRKIVQSLEEKKMLRVTSRPGYSSIYDFERFSNATFELLERENTSQCTPTPTLECTPPLHPNVPEELERTRIKEQEFLCASAPEPSIPTQASFFYDTDGNTHADEQQDNRQHVSHSEKTPNGKPSGKKPNARDTGTTEGVPARNIDQRSKSPQIHAYREVVGRYPPRVNYDQVIASVGDSSVDKLRECYAAWCARGYNPANLAWLDWIASGIPARQNGNGGNGGQKDDSRPIWG